MITSERKERWEIKKLQHETDLSPNFNDREFVIFRTCLNKYQKDLEIVFITKKKFYKLDKKKQRSLKWKYKEDGNKIKFFKYLWCDLRKTKEYTCSKCNERTRYLYMFCINIENIKKFRPSDFRLYCKECWKEVNAPVNSDSKA